LNCKAHVSKTQKASAGASDLNVRTPLKAERLLDKDTETHLTFAASILTMRFFLTAVINQAEKVKSANLCNQKAKNRHALLQFRSFLKGALQTKKQLYTSASIM